MVRFGAGLCFDNSPEIIRFNSSMVRFGVFRLYRLVSKEIRFNSSMVRFGDSYRRITWVILRKFQFQYGAIWRTLDVSDSRSGELVSIPVWCDLEFLQANNMGYTSQVSIPVWCDLEKKRPLCTPLRCFGFNSSMVRFGEKFLKTNL